MRPRSSPRNSASGCRSSTVSGAGSAGSAPQAVNDATATSVDATSATVIVARCLLMSDVPLSVRPGSAAPVSVVLLVEGVAPVVTGEVAVDVHRAVPGLVVDLHPAGRVTVPEPVPVVPQDDGRPRP